VLVYPRVAGHSLRKYSKTRQDKDVPIYLNQNNLLDYSDSNKNVSRCLFIDYTDTFLF
jgi:hypothetical protein